MPKFTKAATKESVISKSSYSSGSSITTTFDPTEVRTVKASECKAAAACLADAFSKDDVAAYFFECPDTANWSIDRKWELHVKILEVTVYAHLKFGLVQAIGDPKNDGSFDSVALWMPPGTNMDSYFDMLMKGVLMRGIGVLMKLSKEGRVRLFKEFIPLLHDTKAEILKERDETSWYLVYLGTHSRARGKGLAKKLVREITKKVSSIEHFLFPFFHISRN
jgi:ribosomal protein S18 acetylase RimI-like enzyme